jgi:hypothetical protein
MGCGVPNCSPNNSTLISSSPQTIIEGEVVKMETCEWCEEENTMRKASVAGSSKLMCETCYSLYLDGRMEEFVNRKNWIPT